MSIFESPTKYRDPDGRDKKCPVCGSDCLVLYHPTFERSSYMVCAKCKYEGNPLNFIVHRLDDDVPA